MRSRNDARSSRDCMRSADGVRSSGDGARSGGDGAMELAFHTINTFYSDKWMFSVYRSFTLPIHARSLKVQDHDRM